MPIHVEIVSREEKVFEEKEADMVSIPAEDGQMGVLPHHAPTVASLGEGELIVKKGIARESFLIFGGVVDVRPDKVVVLAEIADTTFDIDQEKAQEARDHARQLLEEGLPPDEMEEARLTLRRAELQLRSISKIRTSEPIMRILGNGDEA
ncbi:MAG: ATP synthase F1 subunit epsilon [Anaerolineaceae bacterium]|nr:MAG: ATP synthase F1 subunit epsilon [Anaerolineaceae bacterium]